MVTRSQGLEERHDGGHAGREELRAAAALQPGEKLAHLAISGVVRARVDAIIVERQVGITLEVRRGVQRRNDRARVAVNPAEASRGQRFE